MTTFNEEQRLIRSVHEWVRVRSATRFRRSLKPCWVAARGREFRIPDAEIALMSILGIVNDMLQLFDLAGCLLAERVGDRCVDLVLDRIARHSDDSQR